MAAIKPTGRVIRNRNIEALEHTQLVKRIVREAVILAAGHKALHEHLKQIGDELDIISVCLWSNEIDLALAAQRGRYKKDG